METIFVDEKEMTDKFVEKAQAINKTLLNSLTCKMIEYGLSQWQYAGGLSCTISSKSMSLEQNINNLFAAYSSNYAESLFFQCENMKLMNTMNIVREYLNKRGIEDDFIKFRESKEANRIKHEQIKMIE